MITNNRGIVGVGAICSRHHIHGMTDVGRTSDNSQFWMMSVFRRSSADSMLRMTRRDRKASEICRSPILIEDVRMHWRMPRSNIIKTKLSINMAATKARCNPGRHCDHISDHHGDHRNSCLGILLILLIADYYVGPMAATGSRYRISSCWLPLITMTMAINTGELSCRWMNYH